MTISWKELKKTRFIALLLAICLVLSPLTGIELVRGGSVTIGSSGSLPAGNYSSTRGGAVAIYEPYYRVGIKRTADFFNDGTPAAYDSIVTNLGKYIPPNSTNALFFASPSGYNALTGRTYGTSVGWYNSGAKTLGYSSDADKVARIIKLPTTKSSTNVYKGKLKSYSSDGAGGTKLFSSLKDNGWFALLDLGDGSKERQVWAHILENTTAGYGVTTQINTRINKYISDYATMSPQKDLSQLPQAQQDDITRGMLDLLMTLYKISPANSPSRSEIQTAINDYVSGKAGKQNPVAILIDPMIGVEMLSTPGVSSIILPVTDYLMYMGGVEAKYSIYTLGTSDANTHGDSMSKILNVVQKSVNASKDFPRLSNSWNENNPFSNIEVLMFRGKYLRTTYNGAEYRDSVKSKTPYTEILKLATTANGNMNGFLVVGYMVGQPSASFSLTAGRKAVTVAENSPVIGEQASLTLKEASGGKTLPDWERKLNLGNAKVKVKIDMRRTPSGGTYSSADGDYFSAGYDMSKADFLAFIGGTKVIKFTDNIANDPIKEGEIKQYKYFAKVTVTYADGGNTANMKSLTFPETTMDYASYRRGVPIPVAGGGGADIVPDTRPISYHSVPESYSEIKEGTIYNESYEAMAGVPSTEKLYFAVGGSEFIVDVAMEYKQDTEVWRTYHSYFTEVDCEFKSGDTSPNKTVGGVSLNVHTGQETSKRWSGSIPNKAVAPAPSLHDSSCSAIPDMTAYEKDLAAANAFAQQVGATVHSHTASSDKKTRTYTGWSVNVSPSTNPPQDTNAHANCSQRDAQGTDDPIKGWIETSPAIPCGNEMVQATPSGAGSYEIIVTWSVPAHELCGPCCEHVLPQVNDMWKQKITYDHLDMVQAHVWKIDEGLVDGMSDLLGTDTVKATIVRGDPNIFFNFAETETSKDGRLRYTVEPEQHDEVTWAEGVRTNKCNGLASRHGSGGGGHVEPWSTGILYNNTSFSDEVDYHKKVSDDKDKLTEEFKKFDERRTTQNVASVISDMLILQTSSGDQSVIYFRKDSESKQTQEEFPKVIATRDEMWENNPTSSALWEDDEINIGSYNGEYAKTTSKYKGTGVNEKVATIFDNDPAKTITRPTRNTNLQIYKDNNQIQYWIENTSYITGEANVFYKNIMQYPKGNTETIFSLEANDLFGGKVGEQVKAPYSDDHTKVNDVIIHTPVSAQDAIIVGLDPSRDQRSSLPLGTADDVKADENKLKVCPLDPGSCEFRVLNCKYHEQVLLADFDFTGGAINKVNNKTYVLPSGFSIENANRFGSGASLRANGTRWSIPLEELGVDNSDATSLIVEMNILIPSSRSKGTMVLSTGGYDLYFPKNDEGFMTWNTGRGMEKRIDYNMNDKSVKLKVKMSFGDIEDNEVYFNGVKFTNYTYVADSNTLEGRIGKSINIGSWDLNANYPANYYIDNLKIYKAGGSSTHVNACYKKVSVHGTNKVHEHTEDCYGESSAYVCNNLPLNSGQYYACYDLPLNSGSSYDCDDLPYNTGFFYSCNNYPLNTNSSYDCNNLPLNGGSAYVCNNSPLNAGYSYDCNNAPLNTNIVYTCNNLPLNTNSTYDCGSPSVVTQEKVKKVLNGTGRVDYAGEKILEFTANVDTTFRFYSTGYIEDPRGLVTLNTYSHYTSDDIDADEFNYNFSFNMFIKAGTKVACSTWGYGSSSSTCTWVIEYYYMVDVVTPHTHTSSCGSSYKNHVHTNSCSHYFTTHTHNTNCGQSYKTHVHNTSCAKANTTHTHNSNCAQSYKSHEHDINCSYGYTGHNHTVMCAQSFKTHTHDGNCAINYSTHTHTASCTVSTLGSLICGYNSELNTETTNNVHVHTSACGTIANYNCANTGVSKTFNYTGSTQTYITPENGTYTLETWGASGGGTNPLDTKATSRGGAGGYSKGEITLNKSTYLILEVGGQGTLSTGLGTGGGYNGGGNGGKSGFGGGGATSITKEGATESTAIKYWKFDGSLEGFTPANATTLSYDSTCLIAKATGSDPHFVSPSISYNTSDIAKIELKYKNTTGQSSGQIFFSLNGSSYNETQSVAFNMDTSGQFIYQAIDLRNNPKWVGTLNGLRFDLGTNTYTTGDIRIARLKLIGYDGKELIIAGGGGGSDDAWVGETLDNDGSGGNGGGLVGGNGYVSHTQITSKLDTYTLDNKMSLRPGTQNVNGTAVSNAVGQGVFGPYVYYGAGKVLRVTVTGSGLLNGRPRALTNHGYRTWYETDPELTIISKTNTEVVYEFKVPQGVTQNHPTVSGDPYSMWEFCYEAENANTMVVSSTIVHESSSYVEGIGLGGTQNSGYKRGQGQNVTIATDTGGGGGGYYGGLVTNYANGGGGGGSGYVSPSLSKVGTTKSTNVGNGKIVITLKHTHTDACLTGEVTYTCGSSPRNAHVCLSDYEAGRRQYSGNANQMGKILSTSGSATKSADGTLNLKANSGFVYGPYDTYKTGTYIMVVQGTGLKGLDWNIYDDGGAYKNDFVVVKDTDTEQKVLITIKKDTDKAEFVSKTSKNDYSIRSMALEPVNLQEPRGFCKACGKTVTLKANGTWIQCSSCGTGLYDVGEEILVLAMCWGDGHRVSVVGREGRRFLITLSQNGILEEWIKGSETGPGASAPYIFGDHVQYTSASAVGCKEVKTLKCGEPHHNGMHYDGSNPVCWDACGNDNNHKNYKPTVTKPTGETIPNGDFVNLDYPFQIYFPNIGNFQGTGRLGISELTDERGKGYKNNMDTTKWTREKRVRFEFNVIYNGTLYIAGDWIELPVTGADYPYYNFYCVLANEEAKGAKVEFEVEAINAVGQQLPDYSYPHDTNTIYQNRDAVANDNLETTTNKDRRNDYTSKHGAYNKCIIDVVGRIGNLVLMDTEDYRFSNFFKEAKDPISWLIEGFVKEVDQASQRAYLGDTVDIRGETISKGIGYLNTYGTQNWLNKAPTKFPLSQDLNNVLQLRDQPLRLGYNMLSDITTIGNYELGALQVLPSYYHLNLQTGVTVPLDVYMSVDGVYKPISIFNLVQNGTYDKSKVYDYTVSLDWIYESGRRNYTLDEKYVTDMIADTEKTPITDGENVTGFKEWDRPVGRYIKLGNAQQLLITPKARTFIGGTSTYGENKNINDLIPSIRWWEKAQRWHFKVGVPSSAVFVKHGDEPTKENIEKYMSDDGVILLTNDIQAIGNTYSLRYVQNEVTTFKVGGKVYLLPAGIPPIMAVMSANKSAVTDVDITGTH